MKRSAIIGAVVGAVLLVVPPVEAQCGDLLPNLVSLPTRTVSTNVLGGCTAQEKVEDHAVRCLRFDQVLANEGDGPLEVRYRLDDIAASAPLRQRIYAADGTWRDRLAATYVLHPTHAHFHYQAFAQSSLWASNASGTRLDTAPVAVGEKNGFCLADTEHADPATGPATAAYPETNCRIPQVTTTGRAELVQGVSVGWADAYTSNLDGQYIEISGVADGFYLLETTADPDGTLLEMNTSDNTVSVLIELCGNTAQLSPPPSGLDFCP